jgi:3'-5' exoribonuclease
MKQIFIGDIRAGDGVEDVFVLAQKSMAQKRDGGNFLQIELSDKSGSLKGVLWDQVETTAAQVSAGDLVRVAGTVSEYRGALQIVVRTMVPVEAETVDPSDFLPTTGRDIDKMFLRLVQLGATIESKPLRKLLDRFWEDEAFVRGFKNAPAAKKMHHAYIGGLLEHTLSMALLADRVAGHYSGVDRDLLLAGAILHDIGKVREFDFKYRIDYSDEGRLLSHIVIGVRHLEEKIQTVRDFPAEMGLLLKHLIVSHHGAREFGSPEPPKTIEAVLLNYIDEIDAKVNGIREFIATEDPHEAWTSYHRILGRHFYTGHGGA